MTVLTLEVRHLRLVRALADEGGPTRAAARLHLTQSAVSHQLAELEGRLGITLFARVRRRLIPTAAGARLIEEARTLLAELARVERELARAGERKRTVLRVVVETFTTYHWLPSIVAELERLAPHVDVRVSLEAARDPVAALLRGTVDVALVSSPVHERSLAVVPLFDDEWVIVVLPQHPLASSCWVSAAQLGEQSVFAHESPRSDVERLRSLVSAERARMPRVTAVPLTDLVVAFVKAGAGVGLLSRWAASPYVASGEIVALRFTRAGIHERWVGVTRRNSHDTDEAARFVDLVRARTPLLASDARPRSRQSRVSRSHQPVIETRRASRRSPS